MKNNMKLTPWARWLTEQIKKKGWTYQKLAAECDGLIAESTLRRYVHNGHTPRGATRAYIQDALGEVFAEGPAK